MQIAVIDSGTNSFALNIYETKPNGLFKRVYKERYFVELGEDGIQCIGQAAFQRALQAYRRFHQTLQQRQIQHLRALGTAALRTASNGQDLIDAIYKETQIPIELISGDREAELIYYGARLASPISEDGELALVMDIGGGSVEFILCTKQRIEWQHSFPIGASVLFGQFQPSDPILDEEITNIYHTLDRTLDQLWQQCTTHQPRLLVGASGTFDVIVALAGKERGVNPYELVALSDFDWMYERILRSTYEQRLEMPELPPTRAKMIVPVMVLVRLVLERVGIHQLAISDYALREGTAWEMVQALSK